MICNATLAQDEIVKMPVIQCLVCLALLHYQHMTPCMANTLFSVSQPEDGLP